VSAAVDSADAVRAAPHRSGGSVGSGADAPAWLLDVVAHSRFLWERLGSAGGAAPCVGEPAGVEPTEAWLAAWRSRLGGRPGEPDALEERLALAGFSLERVSEVVRRPAARPLPEEALPEWALVLQRVTDAARALHDSGGPPPPVEADDPIPFEGLLVPAVRVGRALLHERWAERPTREAERARRMLTEGALRSLERALFAHLATFCTRPFATELAKLRTFGETLLSDLEVPFAAGTARYERFVETTLREGLLPVLCLYPVLARLVATSVRQWADSCADFIERLVRDLPDLERTFGGGRGPLGRVAALDATLSDRHEGGRTVIVLGFESGVRCVYKPRDLGIHVGFNEVLEFFNGRSGLAYLRPLRVLARPGYGFVEFAEQRPCSTPQEADAFYTRAGMLLCLLYALRGTDCHHENLVAQGDQPLLIDAETVLHPRDTPLPPDQQPPTLATDERFLDSVLRTGMLPRWRFSEDRRAAYDLSALGSVTPQQVPRRVERWVDVNTDAMRPRMTRVDLPAERNVPTLDGEALDPARFRDRVRAGFRAAYDFLRAHEEELLSPGGPVAALRGRRVRYIFRNSQVYGSLLDAAHAPGSLRDGVAFSLALEPLALAFVSGAAPDRARPLLQAEIRALERQDIPLLWVDSGTTALRTSDGLVVNDYFARCGHDEVRGQLAALSPADRDLQDAILGGALDARTARSAPASHAPVGAPGAALLTDDDLLEEAVRIGDEIAARALPDGAGGVTWLGFGYVPEAELYQHRVLGPWLYDGAPGVALFLAALFQGTGDARYADLARGALTRLRRQACADPPTQPGHPRGLGGALGLGSALYALCEIAALLSDPALTRDALRLAGSITPGEVAADRRLDVMGGVAGTILGLASLCRATGSPHALELARRCGRRLLEAQVDDAWPTLGSTALPGMSHGAAGIAYALMRLYAMTGERPFADAALRGMGYERALYRQAGGRWPDLRPGPGSGREGFEPVQWCHGAAGIGLARIGCARVMPSAEVEGEIDDALHAVDGFGLGEIDHLCCGNIGRIETLAVAADHRGRSDLRERARSDVSQVVEKARRAGGYRLFGNLGREVWNPGLFQGTAGIGYQLLRLRSGSLRSFAVWE
jgi:class II lanthipeptide synthase